MRGGNPSNRVDRGAGKRSWREQLLSLAPLPLDLLEQVQGQELTRSPLNRGYAEDGLYLLRPAAK